MAFNIVLAEKLHKSHVYVSHLNYINGVYVANLIFTILYLFDDIFQTLFKLGSFVFSS